MPDGHPARTTGTFPVAEAFEKSVHTTQIAGSSTDDPGHHPSQSCPHERGLTHRPDRLSDLGFDERARPVR